MPITSRLNVRTGPGTDYDSIGVLIAGQVVPALGRSGGGSWIKIVYAGVADGVGWVYSPLVTLIEGGDLPVVEPPPTATPWVTDHQFHPGSPVHRRIAAHPPPDLYRSAPAGGSDLRPPGTGGFQLRHPHRPGDRHPRRYRSIGTAGFVPSRPVTSFLQRYQKTHSPF